MVVAFPSASSSSRAHPRSRGSWGREHAGHRWQVADVAVGDAEQRDDRGLVRRDAVEVAHRYGGVAIVAEASSSESAFSAFLASSGKSSGVQ